jgi:hypothetical protein
MDIFKLLSYTADVQAKRDSVSLAKDELEFNRFVRFCELAHVEFDNVDDALDAWVSYQAKKRPTTP